VKRQPLAGYHYCDWVASQQELICEFEQSEEH
jgi:hypothetical protein